VNDPLIAENLACQYGDDLIVDGADLALQPSSITALLGQSGAGKSTLLRMLAGLERPRSGTVRLGRSVLSSPNTMVRPEERRIGLIFQDFALFPHLTVAQNVAFGLKGARAARLDRARALLDRMDLGRHASAMPHELSGGEQQRVAIARALANDPRLVIADEPTGNLDPVTTERVFGTLIKMARQEEAAVLIATHNMALTKHMDRVLTLEEGKLVEFSG